MKSFFTETILKRGKTYFEQNRVFSVNQYDNQTYTGIILGNEAYHTKITLDEHYDVMSATCDCPYAKEGNHCKHEAALYFAIEDRLPKDEQQYIDINALLKDVRRRTHSSFMLKREFNQEFKKYLKRIIQLNEQGSFHITNYQQVIDEFLNSNYPNDYRHEILQIMFQGYSKLLTSEHNKELTTRWLKENMKYQRYENAFSYIMMIIYKLDVNDQIDIIREMLLTKRKVSLLNTYFKIINDHHLDMKKYLDDIQIYNNNEDYITEMIHYYVDHQQVGLARLYYKKHERNIRKKETKAKLDSLPSYVVAIAATNHDALLDQAVWRRFQMKLELPKPTRANLEKWFVLFEKRMNFSFGLAPSTLAKKLYGKSYAEAEEFALSVFRQYILNGPSAKAKNITNMQLRLCGYQTEEK